MNHKLHLIPAILLLAVMFGLAVGSSIDKSPTFDEPDHIMRGWALWRTGRPLAIGHPPVVHWLVGLGTLLEPGTPEPETLDGWETHRCELIDKGPLLWDEGANARRIVFLARIVVIWLGLLLGAVIWRWAQDVYGPQSAVLALALYTLCPNILAHTRLATTDLGVAAFYVATLYTWSRFLHRQTGRWLIISGILFGLTQGAKFSGLLLVPTVGLMTLWTGWRRGALALKGAGRLSRWFDAQASRRSGWLWTALTASILMGLTGLVVLWAAYLFTLRPFQPGQYLADLGIILDISAAEHRWAYLLGRFSRQGWWYYHLFELAVKLPLMTLLLLATALLLLIRRKMSGREWEIAFPALAYLVGAVALDPENIGIRHLLPAFPLMFLFASRVAAIPFHMAWLRPGLPGIVLAAGLAVNLSIYPHYLAFFNMAAGGPDNGYRLLVDSNLDWGQDLPGLARYLDERDAGTIYLSTFGTADPAYYGIEYIPLPSWPPLVPERERPPFYPLNPAPGLYAISASNLVGVELYQPDSFAFFREREPVARIGHSIFVYEVPPHLVGDGAWAAQCAEQPFESEITIKRLTGLKAMRAIYFNCANSLPIPQEVGWILLPESVEPIADLGPADYLARFPDGSPRYRAWLVSGPPEAPASTVESPAIDLPLSIGGYIDLLGYQVNTEQIATGETLLLTVWWQVREPPPPPVSILAHFDAPDGFLILAGDALGVALEDWQSGMVIIQQHRFTIEGGVQPGEYKLAVGLYSLATGERFPVLLPDGGTVDQIMLRAVEVIEEN